MNEELMKLRAELAAWHEQFGTSQLSHAIAERDGLKKHNAQLAAAFLEYAFHTPVCTTQKEAGCDCGLLDAVKEAKTTFHDLLLPTIDLLQLAISRGCWPHEKCVHNELVRLRDLCGEKGTNAKGN